MSTTILSKIQVKHGLRKDLPHPLGRGEFGFATDTNELFIGADLRESRFPKELYTYDLTLHAETTSNLILQGFIFYSTVQPLPLSTFDAVDIYCDGSYSFTLISFPNRQLNNPVTIPEAETITGVSVYQITEEFTNNRLVIKNQLFSTEAVAALPRLINKVYSTSGSAPVPDTGLVNSTLNIRIKHPGRKMSFLSRDLYKTGEEKHTERFSPLDIFFSFTESAAYEVLYSIEDESGNYTRNGTLTITMSEISASMIDNSVEINKLSENVDIALTIKNLTGNSDYGLFYKYASDDEVLPTLKIRLHKKHIVSALENYRGTE